MFVLFEQAGEKPIVVSEGAETQRREWDLKAFLAKNPGARRGGGESSDVLAAVEGPEDGGRGRRARRGGPRGRSPSTRCTSCDASSIRLVSLNSRDAPQSPHRDSKRSCSRSHHPPRHVDSRTSSSRARWRHGVPRPRRSVASRSEDALPRSPRRTRTDAALAIPARALAFASSSSSSSSSSATEFLDVEAAQERARARAAALAAKNAKGRRRHVRLRPRGRRRAQGPRGVRARDAPVERSHRSAPRRDRATHAGTASRT